MSTIGEPLTSAELETLGYPLAPGRRAYPFYPFGILIPIGTDGNAGHLIVDDGDNDRPDFVDVGAYDPEQTDGTIQPVRRDRLASVVELLAMGPDDEYRWVDFATKALEVIAEAHAAEEPK